MRHAGHRDHRQQQREAGDEHQGFKAGNAGAHDHGVDQPRGQCRGDDGGGQTLGRGHALGEILDQAGAEGDHAAAQHRGEEAPVGFTGHHGCRAAQHHAQRNADAADTRHDPGVEFLGLCLVRVAGEVGVAVRIADQQPGDTERRQERTDDQ